MSLQNRTLPILFLSLGLIVGAGLIYSSLNTEISSLEQELEEVKSQERIVYVNDTDTGLTSLFQQSESSVVYIDTDNAQGSGFVYDTEGHLITNEHVISDRESVDVYFSDGQGYRADVVGIDPYTDLAVLRVDREDLEPLEFADTDDVEVGETAVAVGNPFGLESSITQGIVSQKGRSITVEEGFSISNIIQTDAAINPGNSGGPLMNREGEVIGVNTAIETDTGTFSGIGFAVPSNTVNRVIPEIIEDGQYQHPWIGVQGLDVTPEIAQEMNLDNSTGFLVLEVTENSPAEQAGLQGSEETIEIEGESTVIGGDVITNINDRTTRGIDDILEYLSLHTEVGDEVEIEFLRDGETQQTNLTLQQRP